MIQWSQWFAIASGGALGALGRFLVANGIYKLVGRDFPWGTLVVNISGSFMMGLLFTLLLERSMLSSTIRTAILVGFLGAFTTFSTFSLETVQLFIQGEPQRAVLNMITSVICCVFACWLGFMIARLLN
jgi:CrcB protein